MNQRIIPPVGDDDVGLKVLREAPENASSPIDIVAVHGLGAHPDFTWTKTIRKDGREAVDINWLTAQPFLPTVAKEARIMRYGYESAWFGQTAMETSVRVVATRLLRDLRRKRKAFPFRPLIFIAHCFGGLVVLKTSVLARHNQDEWKGIFQSTVGILTLGTPFRGAAGMKHSVMLEAALKEYTEDQIRAESLNILQNEDETLKSLIDEFSTIHRKQGVALISCFYETGQSNVGRLVGEEDRHTIIVTESSGCLDSAESNSIARNHFNMNKFGSPTEEDFETISEELEKMIEQSNLLLNDDVYKRCKLALYVLDETITNDNIDPYQPPDWLFEHDAFLGWSNGDLKSNSLRAILTLKGGAGTGKTTLMNELARRCEEKNDLVVRYTFGGLQATQMPSSDQLGRFCKSLLSQFLSMGPKRSWHFLQPWESHFEARSHDSTSYWTVSRIREALKEILSYAGTSSKWRNCRVFVDALDACEQSLEVLQFVEKLVKDCIATACDFRVCIARRHQPWHGRSEPESLTITVEDHNEKSVRDFITREVQKIDDRNIRLHVHHRLARHRFTEFEWPKAVLGRVLTRVSNSNADDITKEMDKEFLELSHKFEGFIETTNLDEPKTILLLQIVTAARLSMTSDQVRQALAFAEWEAIKDVNTWEKRNGKQATQDFRAYLSQWACGMLEIHRETASKNPLETVRFVVPSMEGALRRLRVSRLIDPIDWERLSHLALFQLCLGALQDTRGSFPFLEYAWEHWVYHARQCDSAFESLADGPNFLEDCLADSASIIVEKHITLLKRCEMHPTKFLQRAELAATTLLSQGDSMLNLLATHGCTKLLKQHLKSCTSCNKLDRHLDDGPYRTALDNAIITGCHETAAWMVEHCESKGIDALAFGNTLLYSACYYEALDVVAALLHKGANQLKQSYAVNGYPLLIAIERGDRQLFRLLIKHNATADVFRAKCSNGNTALHVALGSLHKASAIRMVLEHMPYGILDELLDLVNENGISPLKTIASLHEKQDREATAVKECFTIRRAREKDETERLKRERAAQDPDERELPLEAEQQQAANIVPRTQQPGLSLWNVFDKFAQVLVSEEEISIPASAMWN